MKEFFKEMAVPILFIGVVILGTSALAIGCIEFARNKLNDRSCRLYQEITGRVTVYSQYDNCYVNVHDVWYTLKEYEMTLAAKDTFTMEDEK